MSIDRRKRSIKDLLQRYIADCQKEKTHRDGLSRLDEKMEGADFSNKLKQVKLHLLQRIIFLNF